MGVAIEKKGKGKGKGKVELICGRGAKFLHRPETPQSIYWKTAIIHFFLPRLARIQLFWANTS